MVSSAMSAPTTRPVLPRTSSAASGLRFCGMMELPVEKRVRERDEAELRTRPEHQLLRKPREVHDDERRSGERLHHEVAVGDGVDGVSRRPVEAQQLGCHGPVYGKGGPGERCCAQRRFVEAPATVGEAPAVAPDHLDVGQEVMAEGDRLRHLQMGEARHDGSRVLLGPVDERGLQVPARRVGLVQPRAEPEPKVRRDLIVARARGVEAAGRPGR